MNKDPEEPVMNIEVEMGIQQVRRIGSSLKSFFHRRFSQKWGWNIWLCQKLKQCPEVEEGVSRCYKDDLRGLCAVSVKEHLFSELGETGIKQWIKWEFISQ